MAERPREPQKPALLTRELLAPLLHVADHGVSLLDVVKRIPQDLADLAVPRLGGGSFRLTDHHVRMALAPVDGDAAAVPFAWSARTVRRGIGLATVRSLVTGEASSPVQSARRALAQAVCAAREGHTPVSPMDRWLAGLPAASLAVIQADVVTWATRLWCTLDWTAFSTPPMIGRDRWWDSPHSSLLAIRSRAEVRTVVSDGAGRPYSAHLVVLGGRRRPTIRAELSAVALVEALLASPSLPPGRIVGWWPDSGHLVRVDIDASVLQAGATAIARALAPGEALSVVAKEDSRAAA